MKIRQYLLLPSVVKCSVCLRASRHSADVLFRTCSGKEARPAMVFRNTWTPWRQGQHINRDKPGYESQLENVLRVRGRNESTGSTLLGKL